MTIAEERASEYYPELNEQDDVAAWHGFIAGYEQAEKDIISLIESRSAEILGDAQPKPALRAELQELIKRIKEEKK